MTERATEKDLWLYDTTMATVKGLQQAYMHLRLLANKKSLPVSGDRLCASITDALTDLYKQIDSLRGTILGGAREEKDND